MNTEAFGEFLRRKREERNLSLREFAKGLGVSAVYLSDIERGNRFPPVDPMKLLCISKALSLDRNDFNTLCDLAGEARKSIAFDILWYIRQHRRYIIPALRTAMELGAAKEDWDAMIKALQNRRGPY